MRKYSVFSDKEWNALSQRIGLTERQSAILKMVIDRHHDQEIARKLNITTRTVRSHLTAIFKVFNVRDRTSLVVEVFARFRNLERS
ncbi:MAG: helix-turn-helix transcriptional regulator [Pirellulaceae bacterium]